VLKLVCLSQARLWPCISVSVSYSGVEQFDIWLVLIIKWLPWGYEVSGKSKVPPLLLGLLGTLAFVT
jgi:hypothetical protein